MRWTRRGVAIAHSWCGSYSSKLHIMFWDVLFPRRLRLSWNMPQCSHCGCDLLWGGDM